jgi:uncharacterized protein YeaO (DUF488 family)
MAERSLKVRTFQIGRRPRPGEGLRIGAARRPPRGVPRARWRAEGYFDIWLPVVAPSQELLRHAHERREDPGALRRVFDAYEREMRETGPRQVIHLLAEVAKRTPISIGCFCEDESQCHRSRLLELIRAAGAAGEP